MFGGVSELELMLVLLVVLLVLGPERLPETLRAMSLWFGRLTRSIAAVKAEVEKEIGMDDVRQQLHNEEVMAQIKAMEAEVSSANKILREPLAGAASDLSSAYSERPASSAAAQEASADASETVEPKP